MSSQNADKRPNKRPKRRTDPRAEKRTAAAKAPEAQNSDPKADARRSRRAELQKKRRRQAIRMRIALLAAILVLAAGGFGLYLLIQNAPGENDIILYQPEQTEEVTEPETEPYNPITSIHIRAAGDLNITDATVDAGLAARGYDFTRAFQDVASTLSNADLTILNLEGNICGEPYGTVTASAPVQLLTALRAAGVDMIQIANSYSIHNGLIGLGSTISAIRAAGLEPVGAYATPADYRRSKGYTICDIQGVKVAVVAFTKGCGGMGMPSGNEDCVNLLYKDYDSTYRTVDRAGILEVLNAVKSEHPDITIALLHWGSENNDTITSTQTSIVKLMQKNGVSVIIGTHPHLVQEVSYDSAAGTLVAYSLGDFFGDAVRGGTNYSIVLDVEITKDASTGVTKVTGWSYTPVYTVTNEQSADGFRRVMRIDETMRSYDGNFLDKITPACYNDMAYSLTRIGSRTAGRG